MSEATKTRRFGFKRWIVLGLIALGIYAAFIGPSYLKADQPGGGAAGRADLHPSSPITNTMLATLVADVVLLLFAFGAWRFHKSGKQVPTGFYNFFEVLVEFLWNGVEGVDREVGQAGLPGGGDHFHAGLLCQHDQADAGL